VKGISELRTELAVTNNRSALKTDADYLRKEARIGMGGGMGELVGLFSGPKHVHGLGQFAGGASVTS
jgi:hypothetical protein